MVCEICFCNKNWPRSEEQNMSMKDMKGEEEEGSSTPRHRQNGLNGD